MKARNKRIYSADQEYLVTIRKDYTLAGFDTELETGVLTIFSRKRKKEKKKKDDKPRRRND